ncbi:MAG: acyltransferase [Candidatus Shapirobacteria bacterium]|jgi:peptidoglycan/LPS O-acetylase OafA/YrhL
MRPGERNKKIDGLRGVLALLVALNHSFLVLKVPAEANIWGQNIFKFTDWQSKINQIMMLVGNGGMAVTIFFLISGLVMSYWWQGKNIGWPTLVRFYGKRFVRLYPAYGLMVVITAIYMTAGGFEHQRFAAASDWYHYWMNFQMTLKELGLNLTMIHLYIGGVTWTLRVIVLATLFFPAFKLLKEKITGWWQWLVVAGLYWIPRWLIRSDNFIDANYFYLFYLGMIIPEWKNSLGILFKKGWGRQGVVWGLVAVAWWARYQLFGFVGEWFQALSMWLVLGVVADDSSGELGFLTSRFWQFFGKISYQFYLSHFTVLYLLARLMFRLNGDFGSVYLGWQGLIFGISTGLTSIMAWLIWKGERLIANLSK